MSSPENALLREQIRALQAENQRLTDREQTIARTMYRRGYYAGRMSERRGRPATERPERLARGNAKSVLR